jgi:hypothetical protein
MFALLENNYEKLPNHFSTPVKVQNFRKRVKRIQKRKV